MLRPTAALALVLSALASFACSGDSSDPVDPTPTGSGSVSVAISVAGVGPQGAYAIVVDGVLTGRFVTPGPSTGLPLPAGRREVRLDSLPAYCTAADNPRAVDVAANASTRIVFAVTCSGATINVQTTGLLPDEDGYFLLVDDDGVTTRLLPVAGQVVVGMPVGTRRLALGGVASNCTVRNGARVVEITPNTPNPVDFSLTCIAGVLRVEAVTTGLDGDGDGFSVAVAVGASMPTAAGRVPANGATPVGTWRDGTQVTASLGNVASNCTPDALSRPATLRAPDTLTVRFNVTCTALPSGGLLLAVGNPDLGAYETLRLVEGSAELFSRGVGYDAEWAPGGRAFAHNVRDTLQLVEVGSGSVRRLGYGLNPAFSPDGRRIYFMAPAFCGLGCYYPTAIEAIDLDDPAPQPRTVFSFPGFYIQSFDVSPDGRRIALVMESAYSFLTYELVVANIDGTDQRLLATSSSNLSERRPRFSPDGRNVLANFRCPSGSGNCGYVVPVDGSPRRQASSSPAFAWSPDGTRIALWERAGAGALVSVRAADGTDRQVLTLVSEPSSVSWAR